MHAKAKLTLLLFVIDLMFAATSQAGVVHDERGKAVEPTPAVDVTDLVPSGKGWGERPETGNATSQSPFTNRETGNAASVSPFIKLVPSGKGSGEGAVTGNAAAKTNIAKYPNGINYHNGPLILGTTDVYYIWYGNWSGNTAPAILNNFASSIGGSHYYAINTTYYDVNKNFVTNAVQHMGAATDNYSQGKALSDASVKTIVANAISSGALPRDSNAVYFVLTSADVNETSGFCTQYCGWHTHGSIARADIKYAFVGNPDRCPSACAAQTKGPSGNAGADGMVSIIAHELEEAVTDPDLNAWYDSRGRENADKCAWTFGTTYTTANGAKANMNLGGRDYLIQQNWVNANGGSCALSYP